MSDEIELSDGGCIEPPEENGDIRRRDVHGNMMDVRSVGDEGWDEWADLFGVSESDYPKDTPEECQRGVEEALKRLADIVAYAPEEDEDHADYDECHCIDREHLLAVLSDVRGVLWRIGIKIPTDA